MADYRLTVDAGGIPEATAAFGNLRTAVEGGNRHLQVMGMNFRDLSKGARFLQMGMAGVGGAVGQMSGWAGVIGQTAQAAGFGAAFGGPLGAALAGIGTFVTQAIGQLREAREEKKISVTMQPVWNIAIEAWGKQQEEMLKELTEKIQQTIAKMNKDIGDKVRSAEASLEAFGLD